MSSEKRETRMSAAAELSLAASSGRFAGKLYGVLPKPDAANLVFSPLSIHLALTMTMGGREQSCCSFFVVAFHSTKRNGTFGNLNGDYGWIWYLMTSFVFVDLLSGAAATTLEEMRSALCLPEEEEKNYHQSLRSYLEAVRLPMNDVSGSVSSLFKQKNNYLVLPFAYLSSCKLPSSIASTSTRHSRSVMNTKQMSRSISCLKLLELTFSINSNKSDRASTSKTTIPFC